MSYVLNAEQYNILKYCAGLVPPHRFSLMCWTYLLHIGYVQGELSGSLEISDLGIQCLIDRGDLTLEELLFSKFHVLRDYAKRHLKEYQNEEDTN